MGQRAPSRTTTRADVLRAMQERDDDREPWTTNELADAVGCSKSTAYNRLGELTTLDLVDSKMVGMNARVWWIPADAVDEAAATVADE